MMVRAALGLWVFGVLSMSCSFDPSSLASDDAGNGPRIDARMRSDARADAANSPDASLPLNCTNRTRDLGETDVDCGGPCPGCAMCNRCIEDKDCGNQSCDNGLCLPSFEAVAVESGGAINAFVREDRAILLAHYGPGHRITGFDQAVKQRASTDGGDIPPGSWAPDPCIESGHLPYSEFDPAGKTVTIACGQTYSDPLRVASSSSLFQSFDSGEKGSYATEGDPGWGMIAAVGSGQGRHNAWACGAQTTDLAGGVAYCDGPSTGPSNHIASYFTREVIDSPYVGCDGAVCNGPSCTTEIWVWLE